MKKTPWFDSSVKPVYKGVYETAWAAAWGMEEGASYWSGEKWSNQLTSWRDFDNNSHYYGGAIQHKRWRGLTTKGGK